MSGYEYSNARLRAMKSRLFNQETYQELAETRTLEQLLRALAQTDYREAIEVTPTISGELNALNSALSLHLRRTLRKVRRIFDPELQPSIAMVLEAYDVNNIKAVLRGLENAAPPETIRDAQLPVGELTESVLLLLAQAPSRREALDLLVTMGLPIARPLLAVRTRQPNASIAMYELALDHWYYSRALDLGRRPPHGAELLTQALAMDADLTNLLTVLRLVYWHADKASVMTRLGVDQVEDLLVGPGSLSFDTLSLAAQQITVDAVVEQLVSTRYGPALESGLNAYRHSQRLSDLERSLRRYRLQTIAGFMRKDPLGIGVFLGYLALKNNEISNLRWIASGIELGLPTQTITNELELVA